MKCLLLLLLLSLQASSGQPTFTEIRYADDFERQSLLLWLPESETPAPLFVFFHGGGFKDGEKKHVAFKRQLLKLREQGFAFASAGYPVLGDYGLKPVNATQDDYDTILKETEKVIRFLQANAKEYNIDPEAIILIGSSAGALISEYLAYHVDLSIIGCIAIQQPYPIDMTKSFLTGGKAPLVLFTRSTPEDTVHSPVYAQAIKDYCDAIDIPCTLYGSPESGLPPLPDGEDLIPLALSFIEAHQPAK